MFLESDIVEFINKIINVNTVQDKEIEKNIKEFSNYLRLTKMADENTLKQVDKIVNCLPEIFSLKQKIGYLDINIILNKENSLQEKFKTKVKKQESQRVYEEKHYNNYTYNTSSSCGGGSSNRRC